MAQRRIGKAQARYAGIETLPNFVFPEDKARNKDFPGAVAAFLRPQPSVGQFRSPKSTAELLSGTRASDVAKSQFHGARDRTSNFSMSGDSISTYDPSWGERIGDAAGRLAMRFGADRYGYQQASDNVRDIADFVPGLGTAVVGDETVRAARRGDYVGAGIGAAIAVASLLPTGRAITSKVLKAVREPVSNAGNATKKRASRSVMIYDPPAKPLRDFALDYPKGAAADETGRLRFDIEGRALVAKHVVGRSMVGQPDQYVGPDGLVTSGTSLTRKGISGDSASNLGGGVGIATFDKHLRTPIDIRLGDWLTPAQQHRVLGHEVDHVIDQVAGQIPDVGLAVS
jgi:hypothetical protein